MMISLFRAGFVVMLGLLLGRLTGLLREMLIANQFGLTAEADIAVLLLSLPDALINLLIAGGISAALVPALTAQSKQNAKKLFWQTNLLVCAGFSFLAFLVTLFPAAVANLFAPGLPISAMEKFTPLFQLVIWSLPLSALAAVSAAGLQAKERFAVPAMGTLIFNLVVVSCLLRYANMSVALVMLANAIVVAALIRWLSQIGLMGIPTLSLKPWIINKSLFVKYVEAVSGQGMLIFLPVVAMAFASFQQSGSIAALNYMNKLIQLPIALGLTVVSTVMLPRLSRFAITEQAERDLLILNGGRVLTLLAIILTAVFAIFSSLIVHLIFSRGAMQAADVALLKTFCLIGCLSIPAQGLSHYCATIFNSQHNTRKPLQINLIGFVSFFFIAGLLSYEFGLIGLVWALTLTHLFVFSMYLWAMKLVTSVSLLQIVSLRRGVT